MGIVPRMQAALEQLYDIDAPLQVADFLVGDATHPELPGAIAGLPEQLFVYDGPDGVELALYVADHVLEVLRARDPFARLDGGNLESFCIALEGVSHLMMVAHRATNGLPVTSLELEVQAEVDKFAQSWVLLCEQGQVPQTAAVALRRHIFDGSEIRAEVPGDQRQRYELATRTAGRYCGVLTDRYGRSGDMRGMQRDLSRYYRTGLASKLAA